MGKVVCSLSMIKISLILALLFCQFASAEPEMQQTMSLMDLYHQMILKSSNVRMHDTPIPMTKTDKKQLFQLFLKHQTEFMKGPPEKKTKFSKPNRSSRMLMSHIPQHLFRGAV